MKKLIYATVLVEWTRAAINSAGSGWLPRPGSHRSEDCGSHHSDMCSLAQIANQNGGSLACCEVRAILEPVSTKRWTHPAVILVATDLNDLERLMPFAMEQGAGTGARLILLHVVATSKAMAVDAAGMPYYDPGGAVELADKSLKTWCDLARSRSIACHAVVREGNVPQQVLSAARQFHADRILLGTRSRLRLSKLILGSVAEQVLRSVNLPVITVGPEAHLPAESVDPERIVLHATSLREASRPSAALAYQIASTLGARLMLLHVLPPKEEMERKGLQTGLDSAALQQLQALAEVTQCRCPALIESHVVHGNPSIEILSEAADRRACLIVLGATQRFALESLTRDRTIYKVLAHARCPVLTMRQPLVNEDEESIVRVAAHIRNIEK